MDAHQRESEHSLAHTNCISFPHANPVECEQLVAITEPAMKRNLLYQVLM